MSFLKSILLMAAQMVVDRMVKYIQREKAKNDSEIAKEELDNATNHDEVRKATDNDDSYSNA